MTGSASVPGPPDATQVEPPVRKGASGGHKSGEEALVNTPSVLAVTAPDDGVRPVAFPPFRQVFDEHAAAVGRTLRYLGVPEADLMDAAQEVFLVVNRRCVDFEGRSRISTWIRQICLRVALSYRRKRRRRREDVVAEPPEAVSDADQHQDFELRERRGTLARLLDALDDDQREVIVLYEIEQLPMREVAAAVGCPVQTAYSRRKAALEKLRGELGQVEGRR
ncbi:MAG TPA: sigma-70 family RNA polymerase sigma factor [Polyangiaceae bacterium]|nr:sigma-70 family RNA polymerase sigma factor [Polyangiaceae bacterium]